MRTITFVWDAPSDGITTGYNLTIFAPGDLVVANAKLGLVTSYILALADDPRTYTAQLVATAAGATVASDPVAVAFVPVLNPGKPAKPTGFMATVT